MTRFSFALILLVSPAAAQEAAPLPPDVSARVEALRLHGERFATLIAAIEREASRPAWAVAPEACGHGAHDAPRPGA